MVTIEKLEQMITLQDKMNTTINPDWRQAGNKWLRAAWVEAAEMMDYCCYKWWKKQTPNKVQAQIELVDIFHFILSQAIEEGITAEELVSCFNDEDKESIRLELGSLSTLEWIEEFVLSLLDEGMFVDYYELFAILCDELNLSFDELYTLYVGKNVLNIFRQDHGYKTGEYIKEWKSPLDPNGLVEDNVYLEIFMAEAVKSQPIDMYTYLYEKLETEYSNNV